MRGLTCSLPGWVVICVLAGLSPARAACVDGDTSRGLQKSFEGLLNSFRTVYDLSAVRVDGRLDAASRDYACAMAEAGHFDHIGPDGRQPADRALAAGFRFCSLGENLGMGHPDETAVMNGWIESAGHRSNLLDPGHQVYGFGVMQLMGEAADDGSQRLAELGRGVVSGGELRETGPTGPRYWVLMLGVPGC